MRGHPVLSFLLGLKGLSGAVEEISSRAMHRFLMMPQYIAQVIRGRSSQISICDASRASRSHLEKSCTTKLRHGAPRKVMAHAAPRTIAANASGRDPCLRQAGFAPHKTLRSG